MLRTSQANRELLEQAGYVFDATAGVWKRRGEHPAFLHGRVLDGAIAGGLTREQIIAWIKPATQIARDGASAPPSF